MAKDYSANNWRRSQIREEISPVTSTLNTDDNRMWKRRVDQIKDCNLPFDRIENTSQSKIERITPSVKEVVEQQIIPSENGVENSCDIKSSKINNNKNVDVITTSVNPILRRSARTPKPRKILDL